MSEALPKHYFRIRENGASVYRVDTENRQRRIELNEIALVNVRNGNIKPHGDAILDEADRAAILGWLEDRRALIERREQDDAQRAIEQLNLTTHWAQSRASDEALEAVTDQILLALHDLRTVLVRKKADRLMKAEAGKDAAE